MSWSEFAMASGEMDRVQFTGFLQVSLAQMIAHSRDGAVGASGAAGQHVRGLPDTEPFNLSVPQLRLTRFAFRSQSRPSLTRVGWGRP